MQGRHWLALTVLLGITLTASDLSAQGRGRGRGAAGASGGGRGTVAAGAPGAAGAAPGRGGGGGGAYPSRPPADPAVAARGKMIYDANCASCHAADMRGTPAGINLVRNQMTMDDQNAELIGKFLQSAHAKDKAPKMALTAEQTHDLVIYMHTFMNYRTVVQAPDINSAILAAGDAKAGEAYFKAKCSSCHSVTGDLAGIGTRYSEPKTLQNTIVSAGGGGGRGGRGGGGGGGAENSRRTVTVTVTPATGPKIEGRLVTYDDFIVTLVEADGTQRTIRRNGDVPKVEIHDPMKVHRDMLLTYQDSDIHNLTAYLVTVK